MFTIDLDTEIELLKKAAEKATAAKYRAQAARESAEKLHSEAMASLSSRFGLDNLGDARAKLVELEAELKAKVIEANEILNQNNL